MLLGYAADVDVEKASVRAQQTQLDVQLAEVVQGVLQLLDLVQIVPKGEGSEQ